MTQGGDFLSYLRRPLGLAGRMARYFIQSKLTVLLVITSLLLGLFAISITPREEEPQIKVPMVDIMVPYPGNSASQVENQLLLPLERRIDEIKGVRYVYGTAYNDFAFLIVRFYVGEDPEISLVKVKKQLEAYRHELPEGSMDPIVRLKTIDDVPVLGLTLWSENLDHTELYDAATELSTRLKTVADVSAVEILGGNPQVLQIKLDEERMRTFFVSPLQVWQSLSKANVIIPAGVMKGREAAIVLESGKHFSSLEEVRNAVIGAYNGRPVYLGEIADISLGGDEVESFALFQSKEQPVAVPAVTLSVAKKRGVNAVTLVETLQKEVDQLKAQVLPPSVHLEVTRNYGETAKEKSDELLEHMLIATICVVIFMGFALGRKEAIVVLVAIPVTLALTLMASYMFGYTLNRVTLFALIFSIGILVDDAIVVVENMHRHFSLGWGKPMQMAPYAVDEVGNPTILATFTVIGALLPLAFVSGLMGPYMRPIPINASASMFFSLLVAFTISPWLAFKLFVKGHREESPSLQVREETEEESKFHRLYDRIMRPIIAHPILRFSMFAVVILLLFASIGLVFMKAVTVKMLPFDNKSEFQVVVDMPEGTLLERTSEVSLALGKELETLPEVESIVYYVGTHSPINFNGLVRHYDMRRGSHVADIQVNLVSKHDRDRKSHAIAADVRHKLREIGETMGANVKLSEVPPGPPVLSTLVAEVHAEDHQAERDLARQVEEIFRSTEGVVDVDTYIEAPQPKVVYRVDQEKAALAGITTEQVAASLRLSAAGMDAGLLHTNRSRYPIPLRLRLPLEDRHRPEDLLDVALHGADGRMVPIGELVSIEQTVQEAPIHHKNLRPTTYVIGDVAGHLESPVYAILAMQDRISKLPGVSLISTHEANPSETRVIKWDGEWQITYEVFRDMGIAFAVVLVLIYIMVVGWFRSFIVPLVIMAPIPLTLVGILPGHWISGIFFTATSMIGFIALAGVIVRNSILLVDFVNLELQSGSELLDAVIKAGAVRFRPIVLTAAALVVGGLVIILDPIFEGLAVSLIAGVTVATFLTLIVIPTLYYVYLKGGDRYKELQGENHESE
ncbi:MAG TPA: efflux RND transporter permease subunit [Thermoanaerobaculia bacterium]|nr:efflux RND transporter permease subunit [Thermoanaerobaculia bacterium]HUM31115.1 efflux RND transporter permease subunit [Thermoanaerobaculia bacterium]HXK69486.1 efflux RND transporter permease subunit [Thermoanaerobaculia bacterium]